MTTKKALINRQEKISITRQCALLGLDRSHLYYQPRVRFDDSQLYHRMADIYAKRPALGYRKIYVKLREEGFVINKKKVYRAMKILGIKSIAPGPNTSQPDKGNHGRPYLLKGLCIYRPNQVWAVDITYIKTPSGMMYLFALIDWHSRYIVGWTLANSMCAEHAVSTLMKALKHGRPVIINADQGSQFTGEEWIKTLESSGIQVSHDGVGRCIDNIRIERFWRTIKYEDINIKHYENAIELRKGINDFIDYYNNERHHQALDYKRPRDVFFHGHLYKGLTWKDEAA